MFSSMDLPAIARPPSPPPPQPVAAEQPSQMAHTANPIAPNHHHNHPPYAEMIMAAIAALKERNGSRRSAIEKYIAKEYMNLPEKHSALLTDHLKRLKNSGQLLMVKRSYKLPRSTASPLPSATDPIGNGNAFSSGQKIGLIQLPNTEVEFQPIIDKDILHSVYVSLGLEDEDEPQPQPEAQPTIDKNSLNSIYVSLGLEPEPEPEPEPAWPSKRGLRGLPKSGMVRMDSGAKRGCHRPSRPNPLSPLMGQSEQKRRPRHPRAEPVGSRPRGRPKKDASVVKKTLNRGCGRLPKNTVAATAAGADVVAAFGSEGCTGSNEAMVTVCDGMLPAKCRGRPPGSGRVKKPGKVTRKPLDRPRKKASIAGGQAVAAQQVAYEEELKNKLEHFQSRVRHAVNVLKPHLNNETAEPVLGALQELEQLATLDLSTPFHVQDQ